MKEYRPLLLPRKQYVEERSASEFRNSIWTIIARLNPNTDGELNLGWRFSGEREDFRKQAEREFGKTMRSIELLDAAIQQLDRIRPLRAAEPSQRWRAAYDLTYAQCKTYKVRLFQHALALDYRMTVWPKFKNEETNRLDRYTTQDLREPDERQLKLTGISLEEMDQARKDAISAFDAVVAEHPGTPWAVRADIEKRKGFGTRFREVQYYPKPPETGREAEETESSEIIGRTFGLVWEFPIVSEFGVLSSVFLGRSAVVMALETETYDS